MFSGIHRHATYHDLFRLRGKIGITEQHQIVPECRVPVKRIRLCSLFDVLPQVFRSDRDLPGICMIVFLIWQDPGNKIVMMTDVEFDLFPFRLRLTERRKRFIRKLCGFLRMIIKGHTAFPYRRDCRFADIMEKRCSS